MYFARKAAACASCSFAHHLELCNEVAEFDIMSKEGDYNLIFFCLFASISLLAVICLVRQKAVRLRAWVSVTLRRSRKYVHNCMETNSANILPRGSQVLQINIAWTFTLLYVPQIWSWPWTWSSSDFMSLYNNVSHVLAMILVKGMLLFSW